VGEKDLLRIRDVEREYRVNRFKLRKDIASGRGIPCIRIGRGIYFSRSAIEEFLRKNTIPTADSV